MTRWAAFAGITAAVLALLLVLARASQSVVTGRTGSSTSDGTADPEGSTRPEEPPGSGRVTDPDGAVGSDGAPDDERADPIEVASADPDDEFIGPGQARFVRYGPEPPERHGERSLSTHLLLANVAVSQGVLAAMLAVGAWYAEIPAAALGVGRASLSPAMLALGVGFGLALAAANTAGGALARALGLPPGEELRELLAPDSPAGWALLFFGVLPVIAGFEELLFRGALVGALAAGFGVSPWLLAVLSSVAFAVGHGAQGPAGVVVTGLLGFVLAAGFVLTGSLLVVVVAHYLVNAVEFVVYEALDVDWV